jgi:formate dehydrogenase subunit beta
MNAPPTLVGEPSGLEGVNPFHPVMPVNAGSVVARMTAVEPAAEPIVAVLRPCETRALVELVKLKQASLENVTILAVDCPGTVDLEGFQGDGPDLAGRLAEPAPDLRDPCRLCTHPSPAFADAVLCLYGVDLEAGLLIEARTAKGETLLDAAGLEEAEVPSGRADILAGERSRRAEQRKTRLATLLETSRGTEGMTAFLAKCIKCQNCRTVCPVCYCKECFFDSPTFEMEAAKYLGRARARGAFRLPEDTLLFHLTRMNHMATSCVNCGMCSQACPNGIDVGALFSAVGDEVQAIFDYRPGESVEDDIPFTTFREDELTTFG